MQIKTIATVLVSSLVLSGCSLLPGQADKSTTTKTPEGEVMIQKGDENAGADTMLKEDAMKLEGETQGMVGEDAIVGDDDSMEKDAMLKAESTKLVASNFTFGVEEIRVKQGEELTVSVMNEDGFHDFVIDELDVNSGMIPEGDTMEITIPTDKPGTYEYYCSVGNHRAQGMKGTLIIE